MYTINSGCHNLGNCGDDTENAFQHSETQLPVPRQGSSGSVPLVRWGGPWVVPRLQGAGGAPWNYGALHSLLRVVQTRGCCVLRKIRGFGGKLPREDNSCPKGCKICDAVDVRQHSGSLFISV